MLKLTRKQYLKIFLLKEYIYVYSFNSYLIKKFLKGGIFHKLFFFRSKFD